MHIVLGGTGHVGSALARELIARGEPVTVVTHDPDKRGEWEARGARVAVADVRDSAGLREVLRSGRRLFLLNPPADPATDTDAVEKAGVASILAALEGSGLEKIVAESTYGAQPLERAGDLGVLYAMERALESQPIPCSVIRAAYYMSNWDAALASARERGVVTSFLPASFHLPMVATRDLGLAAAELMTAPASESVVRYAEGPRRYSPEDVAACFASALGRDVRVEQVPRERWVEGFREQGFSQAAAESYAAMTAATVDGLELAQDPWRGPTTLREHIDGLAGAG
ncbi:NmrA family NAD(P)-binding protein [Lysobacter enzymogenes]|uniref:TrkA-N domain-containing protein n=1 Tax=Lysobacter enzymogenes TaxID=69 RepID=A0AAU9AKR5_LYSEN|nr:NmrA family NAD(P)-binding protein [Lysobacter enzymogenes]BAV99727.1 TrkA-N domain-containing protein [Lysobacter enzymogenes]